MKYIVSMNWP